LSRFQTGLWRFAFKSYISSYFFFEITGLWFDFIISPYDFCF